LTTAEIKPKNLFDTGIESTFAYLVSKEMMLVHYKNQNVKAQVTAKS